MDSHDIRRLDPADPPALRAPWLVAAWPGMGGVAAIAGGSMARSLDAQPAGMIPERDFFSIEHVDVRNGIARSGALPRSMFFAWRDPRDQRDLLIFLGEAQPNTGGYALCHRIIDVAREHDVERIVTFAAMGTTVQPDQEPRVLAAVTDPPMLDELNDAGIERLQDGQVSGLNGSLLAAAADRGIPAACLLGEMPFFAAGVPNPRSSLAVVEAFERLSGVDVDTSELSAQASQMEPQLQRLAEQLRQQTAQLEGQVDDPEAMLGDETFHEEESTDSPRQESEDSPALDDDAVRRVEALFERVRADRENAPVLKAELDRLGVFDAYEDRFLDLFRNAG